MYRINLIFVDNEDGSFLPLNNRKLIYVFVVFDFSFFKKTLGCVTLLVKLKTNTVKNKYPFFIRADSFKC